MRGERKERVREERREEKEKEGGRHSRRTERRRRGDCEKAGVPQSTESSAAQYLSGVVDVTSIRVFNEKCCEVQD